MRNFSLKTKEKFSLDNEQLAKSALNCLENFLIACGKQFDETIWDKTCASLLQIFRSTLPEQFVVEFSNEFFDFVLVSF